MLQSLHIRDLALIESAELRLGPGLNVLSGETGGGKSLLVTALGLLRGGRASSGLVRHGAEELRVDGEFRLGESARSAAAARLVEEVAGVELEEGVLVLTRIVDARGRSKVRLNGRPATLAQLRELGAWLLEIHGQGEERALMRPEIQVETLDAFAGTAGLRARFARALAHARRARARLREAAGSEHERLARLEFLRFQKAEMEAVGLRPGELEELGAEHRVLAHLDRLRSLLGESLAELQDREESCSDLLGRAGRSLREAAGIDGGLDEAAELVAEAETLVAEASRQVQSGLGRLELEPGRLEHVEERLAALRRALARFGPREEDFAANLAALGAELDELDAAAGGVGDLETDLREQVRGAVSLGRRLVRARRKAAAAFAGAIQAELGDLGMARAELRVEVADCAGGEALLDRATAHGPGRVELLVRINPGEPFHPLADTASGGELARLVLALKKCLADQDRVPLLVLDEVDAEIGGRLGLAVGGKLREVSRHHQVVIVTHLPQVAAFADEHFHVRKRVARGRTLCDVARLDRPAIERELAAMSVGEGADPAAIAEARRLMARARDPSGRPGGRRG